MSDNDEAEISMALTTGLSHAEHQVAEAITNTLIGKGLQQRPVWCRSSSTNTIELQIPHIRNGKTIVDFQPDAFLQADVDELTKIVVQELGNHLSDIS